MSPPARDRNSHLRNVDGLHGRDRAGAGGGNAFLQLAHLGRQGRLVAHCRRHTTQQGRHFRARHREAEDVVDEEQHILALVTEVFGHRQSRKSHAQTHAGRLIHLAVDHDRILHNARFEHFTVKLGAFTGAFAHAGKHRVAFMLGRHRADEFHDDDGLAGPCAAEDAGLTALGKGSDQVNDLDTGFEDLHTGGLFREGRRTAMDGIQRCSIHLALFIHRFWPSTLKIRPSVDGPRGP
jgi:hypothetical protein